MKCLKKPVSLLLVLVFLLGLLPGTALAVSSTTVYFDATGGTVDPASKETTDSTYGTLPTPTRYGYVFAGWYDAEKDGNQVSSSTEVPTEEFVTLYAYWTPVQCTVSFDTAGGTVATSSVLATYGSVYSILPVPVREGYSFAGWYTSAGGNVQVTEGTLCQWPFDHTLYARWVENADEKGRVSELTYRFDNSAQGFGYDQDYTIPLERYQAVFGATPLAHTLYTMQGSWSGNCFGMSTTSGLVFQHSNGITPSDFNPRAARLSDLGLTDKDSGLDMTVQEFVETMQISQLSGKFNDARVHYMNNLDGICQAVEQFAGSGNFAPVILIYGQDRSGGPGGHAVVGYKLVEKSATESWLMIYDCNYPGNEQRHITLTKDIDGAYTGWEYELVGLTASSGQELPPLVWGSGQPNSSITCVTYADYNRVWSERGTAENSLYSEEDVAMMWINTYNAEIRDEHNEVIAVVRNGWLSTNRPDKIQQIITVGMTLTGATAEAGASQMQQDTYLTLPVGFYTITNTDSAARNLAVEIFTATADTIDAAASIDEIYDYDFIDATSTGGRISLYLQTEPENRAAYVAAYGAGAEYSFYIVTPWDFGRAQQVTELSGTCAGQKAAKRGCEVFQPSSKQASCNYVVGYDGSIGLCVEEKDRSWCTGGYDKNGNPIRVNGISGKSNDYQAVTIEVACESKHPYAITEKAMAALIELCADICRRNGIKKLLWFGNKDLVGQPSKQNMTVHRWFANKACPGDYIYQRLGDIAAKVNAKLGAAGAAQVPAAPVSKVPYTVRITATDLRIRKGPGTNTDIVQKAIAPGVYTIVSEATGKGATLWGKLKSGLGWVSLDFCKKI